MRNDKLTSRFQTALADAQSLAVGPRPPDDRACPRAARAARPAGRQPATAAGQGRRQRRQDKDRSHGAARPPAEGRRHAGRGARLAGPHAAAERHRQAGAAARRPVHLQRAVRAGGPRGPRRTGQAAQGRRAHEGEAREGHRRSARRRGGERPQRRGKPRGALQVHHRPDRARRQAASSIR